MKDFNQIDQGHKGYLNLLDIKDYGKKGPEQTKAGKFLEDNYDSIRGIGAVASTVKRSSYITMSTWTS